MELNKNMMQKTVLALVLLAVAERPAAGPSGIPIP